MKRLLLLLAACSAPNHPAPPPLAHRLVVVSVDGLMPDAYLDPDAHGLAIPTLRALVARWRDRARASA